MGNRRSCERVCAALAVWMLGAGTTAWAQPTTGGDPAKEPAEPAEPPPAVPDQAVPDPTPPADVTPPAAAEEPAPPGPGTPAAADPEAEEADEDDDWDSGPVDRVVRISGVFAMSGRATMLSESTLPDGTVVDKRDGSFQIEHTHVKLSGDLSHHVSWEIMPCVMHMNDFSVITALVAYEVSPKLIVTGGRFLLPFGQFNLRSLPGQFATVSRPLLYQSHEDRTIAFAGATPSSFLFTPREDVGVQANGSIWLGAGDVVQVSYTGYVTNGLRAVSDTPARFWDDNNDSKQLGGRLSGSYNGARLNAGVGASALWNRYEARLDQVAWAVDAAVAYQWRPQRRIQLRGELAAMAREVQPGEELLRGDEGIWGGYLTVEADVTAKLGVFYQFDALTQRIPQSQLDEGFRDLELTANRHLGGMKLVVDEAIDLRLEYSLWLEPMGVPDAHRLSVQAIVGF